MLILMMFSKKKCASSDSNIVCNPLKTYYQNGLRTKLNTFRCNFILFDSYDIIILTETWLTPDIGNAELGFVGFHIFRFDRNSYSSSSTRGGGLLIAVKSNLNASLIVNNCKFFVIYSVGEDEGPPYRGVSGGSAAKRLSKSGPLNQL